MQPNSLMRGTRFIEPRFREEIRSPLTSLARAVDVKDCRIDRRPGRHWSLGLRLVTVSYISVGVRLIRMPRPGPCDRQTAQRARRYSRRHLDASAGDRCAAAASCPNTTVSRISGESGRQNKHRGDNAERLDCLAKAIDNGHAWKSLGGLHG